MNFSLFVVFEGQSGQDPVPLCRIADPEITRQAVSSALEKAAQRSHAAQADAEGVVCAAIDAHERDLRGILALL